MDDVALSSKSEFDEIKKLIENQYESSNFQKA